MLVTPSPSRNNFHSQIQPCNVDVFRKLSLYVLPFHAPIELISKMLTLTDSILDYDDPNVCCSIHCHGGHTNQCGAPPILSLPVPAAFNGKFCVGRSASVNSLLHLPEGFARLVFQPGMAAIMMAMLLIVRYPIPISTLIPQNAVAFHFQCRTTQLR